MNEDALPHALAEWIAGWQDCDPDRVEAVYAEHAVHEIVATGQTLKGPKAMRANMAAFVAATPDGTLTVNQALAAGDVGAIDWSYAGHYTNPASLFPPASGLADSVRAAILFQLAEGVVVGSSGFYDLYGLLVQLGVVPLPRGVPSDEATRHPERVC
jgi:steroid delta-isomerase-like uncharacterized protein